MNKLKTFLSLIAITTLFCCKNQETNIASETQAETKTESKTKLINRVYKLSEIQYTKLIKRIENNKPLLLPRSITEQGELSLKPNKDWTSGFFAGSLWYIHEYNNSEKWKNYATKFTEALEPVRNITNTHDVGLMLGSSYGHAHLLTRKESYKKVLVQGAKSLIKRYKPNIGSIQSWDTTSDMGWISKRGWDTPVIIDNMMNLDLLYKASELSNDSTYFKIATKHAETTLKNHFRSDNSSYHVVDYNHETGEVISKQTAQGYLDSSSWARGQAWGLYGFTQTFRNTKNNKFLTQAVNIASYIMDNSKIPSDNIPYWDYDAPNIPNALKDASAAAITASALLDLQLYVPEKRDEMIAYAERILRKLSSEEYLAKPGEIQGFILKHSVGNINTGEENDKPLVYADYYFLEALMKWKNL